MDAKPIRSSSGKFHSYAYMLYSTWICRYCDITQNSAYRFEGADFFHSVIKARWQAGGSKHKPKVSRRTSRCIVMAEMEKITHCIFDMDGLLLDTEKFYTIAQSSVLAEYGKGFNWDLKAKIMGKKTLEAAQILLDESGLHGVLSPEDFVQKRDAILDSLFPTSQLMPGAERLIRHLTKHGIPFCLATSSLRKYFEVKTQCHTALFSLFHHTVTGVEWKTRSRDFFGSSFQIRTTC
eukprot:jgi/Botrbrau1/16746/Bobra.0277s0003.2